MKENYQKNTVFPLRPVSFNGQDYENQKVSGTSYHSLFVSQNMFRKIPFVVVYHLGNFDDLLQSGFGIVPNITFDNLCKPIHDVIIIPVSSDPLNMESGNEGGKILKNATPREIKSYLDEKNNFS